MAPPSMDRARPAQWVGRIGVLRPSSTARRLRTTVRRDLSGFYGNEFAEATRERRPDGWSGAFHFGGEHELYPPEVAHLPDHCLRR